MPKMKKANRVIDVVQTSAASYLARGYDQISDNGEIEKPATGGRNVSIAEYNKVFEKLAALEQKPAKDNAELKELNKEVTALNKEIERLTGIIERNAAKDSKNK